MPSKQESKLQWWYQIFYHALNISIRIEPSPHNSGPDHTKQRQLHLWCMLRLATCEEDREQLTNSTSPRWRWWMTSSRLGYLAAELQWTYKYTNKLSNHPKEKVVDIRFRERFERLEGFVQHLCKTTFYICLLGRLLQNSCQRRDDDVNLKIE